MCNPNIKMINITNMDFPSGSNGEESTYSAGRRPGFNPWVGKFPQEKGMATQSSILA